jgi:ornithine cyclodeaminase/alanine dehydrogenase-like protein (mu-crystallin family)
LASYSFKKTAEKLFKNIKVEILSTSKQVCHKSDIFVTATCKDKDTSPVVYDKWIRDGIHINAVGGDSPNKIDLEKSLVERSKVIVDFQDQTVYEGESQQIFEGKIYADLSEIITGQKKVENMKMKLQYLIQLALQWRIYKYIY